MNLSTKRKWLWFIVILSVIGLLTSVYLTVDHLIKAQRNAVCDLTATVSCSALDSSKYSELFNLPLASLGIVWFLGLMFICFYLLVKNVSQYHLLLGWAILGLLFVFYFIGIEILIHTICPFCTVVHIIIMISFIISVLIYRSEKINQN